MAWLCWVSSPSRRCKPCLGRTRGQGSQGGPHWLDDARDALPKGAEDQGRAWLGQAQDGLHQAGEWAGHAAHDAGAYAAASAGQWVNGQWVPNAPEGGAYDEHEAALGALGHGAASTAGVAALDLNDRDRLPWLENQEEDEDYYAVDTRRVIAAVVGGLLVLALVVGASGR
jgi:hypothetical protein